MTIYARSDLAAVAVSADHGGCGVVHSRPVVGGAPAKIWALDCHACEDFLRSDSLWSPQATTIPETLDEENTRKDVEKRGAVEQAQGVADALGQLAKLGDLPAILGQFMQYMTTGNIGPAAPIGATKADIVATPKPSEVPQLAAPQAAAPVDAPPTPAEPDYDFMGTNELRELAKKNGVPITRSREDQIAALKSALGS
jgi:hypothetical protein